MKPERLNRQQIDKLVLERIKEGRMRVDKKGRILSLQRDGSERPIGHESNNRRNIAVNFSFGGQVYRAQGGRIAWAIHHGEWPPADMSVMMVNGKKGDFTRKNLALVPSGTESAFRGRAVRDE